MNKTMCFISFLLGAFASNVATMSLVQKSGSSSPITMRAHFQEVDSFGVLFEYDSESE